MFQSHVAPRAGAWIEIQNHFERPYRLPVAPRAGAWIEISALYIPANHSSVAPRAGAWIEINVNASLSVKLLSSHPVRVRGLKCKSEYYAYKADVSHPVRVRGLKS